MALGCELSGELPRLTRSKRVWQHERRHSLLLHVVATCVICLSVSLTLWVKEYTSSGQHPKQTPNQLWPNTSGRYENTTRHCGGNYHPDHHALVMGYKPESINSRNEGERKNVSWT